MLYSQLINQLFKIYILFIYLRLNQTYFYSFVPGFILSQMYFVDTSSSDLHIYNYNE